MKFTYNLFTAVNNEQVYTRNLLSSPDIRTSRVKAIAVRDAKSASEAYNRLLCKSNAQVAVFAHQDIYLPQGWFERLDSLVSTLPTDQWGVLGAWGVDAHGSPRGLAWCNSVGRVINAQASPADEVVSLDEMILVVNRLSSLRFDELLPGFHLYGTDIVLQARMKGLKNYAIRNPVIHNCRTRIHLDSSYRTAYNFMRKKWRNQLPLHTCIIPVTWSRWPLLDRAFRMRIAKLRGRRRPTETIECPQALAVTLGWE